TCGDTVEIISKELKQIKIHDEAIPEPQTVFSSKGITLFSTQRNSRDLSEDSQEKLNCTL
ncbi:hypothetical protein, partial [Legionella sp.]|uniref:hypothetical protein n=1 Tax=Legionella sp. TaxID=459 RepID=UPI003C851508